MVTNSNNSIKNLWGNYNNENWKKIVEARKKAFKNESKEVKEHAFKILTKSLEPTFYNCIFCKTEKKYSNRVDKFNHVLECTRSIFIEMNSKLKNTSKHYIQELFLTGANERKIRKNVIVSATKLHYCIWKNRLLLKNESRENYKIYLDKVYNDYHRI